MPVDTALVFLVVATEPAMGAAVDFLPPPLLSSTFQTIKENYHHHRIKNPEITDILWKNRDREAEFMQPIPTTSIMMSYHDDGIKNLNGSLVHALLHASILILPL